MAKVIFVVQRRADMTREQCLEAWAGEQHTSIVVMSAPFGGNEKSEPDC